MWFKIGTAQFYDLDFCSTMKWTLWLYATDPSKGVLSAIMISQNTDRDMRNVKDRKAVLTGQSGTLNQNLIILHCSGRKCTVRRDSLLI